MILEISSLWDIILFAFFYILTMILISSIFHKGIDMYTAIAQQLTWFNYFNKDVFLLFSIFMVFFYTYYAMFMEICTIYDYAVLALYVISLIFGVFFNVLLYVMWLVRHITYIPMLFQFLAILLLLFLRLDSHYILESEYFNYEGILCFGFRFVLLDYLVKGSKFYKERNVVKKLFLFLPFVLTSFCIFVPSLGFIYAILDFRPINPLTGEIADVVYSKYFLTLKYVFRPEDRFWVREHLLEVLSTNVNISRADALSWKTKICSLVENGASISVINAYVSENKKSLELVLVSETLTKSGYDDSVLLIGSALVLLALGGRILYWCFKPGAVRENISNVSKSGDSKGVGVYVNKLGSNLEQEIIPGIPLRAFVKKDLSHEVHLRLGLDRLDNLQQGVISVKFGTVIKRFKYDDWFGQGDLMSVVGTMKGNIRNLFRMKALHTISTPRQSFQITVGNPFWLNALNGIIQTVRPDLDVRFLNEQLRHPKDAGNLVLLPETRAILHDIIKNRWRSLTGLSTEAIVRIDKLLEMVARFL